MAKKTTANKERPQSIVKCGQCKYWRKLSDGLGRCHINSVTVALNRPISSVDWCGEGVKA